MTREKELAEFLERVHKDSGYSEEDQATARAEMDRLDPIAYGAWQAFHVAFEHWKQSEKSGECSHADLMAKMDAFNERLAVANTAEADKKLATARHLEISTKRQKSMEKVVCQNDNFRAANPALSRMQ